MASFDRNAYRELNLYAENDYETYQRQQAFAASYKKKAQKGTYNPLKAEKGLRHVTDFAARKYAKEFGGNSRTMFPGSVRNAVARSQRRYVEREYLGFNRARVR